MEGKFFKENIGFTEKAGGGGIEDPGVLWM